MRTTLKTNADLAVGAIGLALILTAVTILASWPWALLIAGIALLAFATLVIQ